MLWNVKKIHDPLYLTPWKTLRDINRLILLTHLTCTNENGASNVHLTGLIGDSYYCGDVNSKIDVCLNTLGVGMPPACIRPILVSSSLHPFLSTYAGHAWHHLKPGFTLEIINYWFTKGILLLLSLIHTKKVYAQWRTFWVGLSTHIHRRYLTLWFPVEVYLSSGLVELLVSTATLITFHPIICRPPLVSFLPSSF